MDGAFVVEIDALAVRFEPDFGEFAQLAQHHVRHLAQRSQIRLNGNNRVGGSIDRDRGRGCADNSHEREYGNRVLLIPISPRSAGGCFQPRCHNSPAS